MKRETTPAHRRAGKVAHLVGLRKRRADRRADQLANLERLRESRSGLAGSDLARIVIDRAKVESAGRKLRAIGEVLVRTVTVSMKDEPRDRDDGPPVVGGLQLLKPGRPRRGRAGAGERGA